MGRRFFQSLLTLACVSLTLALLSCKSGVAQSFYDPRPRRPIPVGQSYENRLFNRMADDYLRGYYEFNPTEATALGLHQYDAQLESRSRAKIEAEISRLREALNDLRRINEPLLSDEVRYDYLVLQSHVRAQLLELTEIRMWQRDPNLYNRLLAASVDTILKRNYAPIEVRLEAVIKRERQISRLLMEARSNLQNPPRIYTEMAIAQVRGSIDHFTRNVPQMIERQGGGRLNAAKRAEFTAVNDSVIAALRSFTQFLERDLLPVSTGDYAIGAENYRRKLLYEEMVDAPLQQLIQDGERELRQTQNQMRQLAEEIASGRSVAQVLRLLGREHPTADGLVGETRAELDRARLFVRTQNLLTPPSRENLTVAETPQYRRSTSFASMDSPGPFETMATEAYYYVTPPDPQWDARRREDHLSFYNRYALPVISIHEVYPGHYYQFLALKRSNSRIRKVFGASSFIEGWAHYCEQMMLDEGFGGNNPKLRLAQLNLALLRLCRYLVGLRLHTEGMTYDQAVGFFVREGYQEQVNAEREARRGTVDPTYLVYTLGKMEILRLREDYRRRLGAQFRLNEFHDRVLSYGMPPVKILRMALLDEAAGKTSSYSSGGAQREAGSDRSDVVDFSLLASGMYSGYDGGRKVQLITNANEWQEVWRVIGIGRPLPEVNFNTRAVIVAYQGEKPSGGYSIEISEVRRRDNTILVRVNERSPGAGMITTQALTSPFAAVSIPRPPGGAAVQFDTRARETNSDRGATVSDPASDEKLVRPRGTRRSIRRRARSTRRP